MDHQIKSEVNSIVLILFILGISQRTREDLKPYSLSLLCVGLHFSLAIHWLPYKRLQLFPPACMVYNNVCTIWNIICVCPVNVYPVNILKYNLKDSRTSPLHIMLVDDIIKMCIKVIKKVDNLHGSTF